MNTPTPTSSSHELKGDGDSLHRAPPSPWLRLGLCLAVIVVSGFLFATVGSRLMSQIYYTKANSAFKAKNNWIAVQHLKKAIEHQPKDIMFRRKLGEVYSAIGENEVSLNRAFMYAERARGAYLEANRLNPLDAATVIGLAKAEDRMQQLYALLYPGNPDNPYNPLPFFEAAIKTQTQRHSLSLCPGTPFTPNRSK